MRENTQAQVPMTFPRVMLLTALVAFAFQGSRGLFDSTEGRYAECARQTMEQGNLWEPVLNGEHHWTKPPLTYMVIAAGYKVLGVNEWGARTGHALALIATTALVYTAGNLMWPGSGIYASLAYGLAVFPVGASHALSTDAFLVFFLSAAIAAYWAAVRKRKSVWIIAMWVAFGGGFMTKGPVVFLMFLPVATAHILFRRQGKPVPMLLNPIGLIAFAVTGLTWYGLMIHKYPELLGYWVLHETIGRNLYGEFNRNPEWYKPLTVYGPVLLLGGIPWTLPLIPMIRRAFKAFPDKKAMFKAGFATPERGFLTGGVLFPVIILSLATSRLALYVLPVQVILSLAAGRGLQLLTDSSPAWLPRLRTMALVTAVVFIAAKGIAAWVPAGNDMRSLSINLKPLLSEWPEHDLYVLRHTSLYGLQFYLKGDPVPQVELEDAQKILQRARDTGRVQLVLMRTRTLKKLEGYIDQRIYRVMPVNHSWTMIVIDRQTLQEKPDEQRSVPDH